MAGSKELNVDQGTVETEAAKLSGAAGYFTAEALSSQDGTSTIRANGISKTAFQQAQQLHASLGTAMDQEVANIRSLKVAFKEFDEMMNTLNRKG